MRPETICFITAAVIVLALSGFADREDRPAARFCATVLLLNTTVSNIGWYLGIRIAGENVGACAMVALIYAIFRYQRYWTLPLASLAVAAMVVRGIFEIFGSESSQIYWYKMATVNLLFAMQLATVATASLNGGGRRGDQFDVGDTRNSRGSDIGR